MAKKSKQIVRTVDEFGTITYTKNGKLHRKDGPAVILLDGTLFWYKDGERHRKDGPAVIYANGTGLWFKNGKEVSVASQN